MIELSVAIKNKAYANSKQTVLAQLDFTVKSGEFVAIIGPSGCGKSTLLNMISGLETCSGQHISYNESANTEGNTNKDALQQLGYIFQQPRLMPWLTVRENIELILQADQFDKIDDLLAQVGLANEGDYFPSQLSGGMQRRVSIARAFAINPQLLLLDEPFNSLDAPTAARLRQLLMDLCKQRSTTVVFVTHDLQEAVYLADRIIFLSDSPSRIIHQSVIDLPRPRKESGVSELAWQAKLLLKFPGLLAGRID
ncbi:ABC transporter ATP-binding protein [Colwellia psychrerythraea]|uniref:Taurine-transporting ATPase n=1 Tax=Colwellia psychrerythraea TaxID=28229 RepID=A0A099KB53_COLPS|nr:ABC transporter ATP-binding protein [Colwellia psychrerythraea]KGJ87546.1 Taurine-transporting ATPase [Colwellia psychrerythraea]